MLYNYVSFESRLLRLKPNLLFIISNRICEAGLFQLVRMEELVFERARQIARQTTARLGTRTADLLHVACTLAAKADNLYSFDQQQRRLAEAMKLRLNSYKPQ